MNTNTTYAVIVATVLIVALILVFAWAQVQRKRKQQSLNLRQRFGPEYDRTVNELGDRGKAEQELEARRKRVARLDLVPLTVSEASRFRQAWVGAQARFVDDPKAAVIEADHLVYELMAKRGYPMGDFDARAADISVDHPGVVANYRAARAIALADERGQADTELQRRAVVHYRALFDELLEVRDGEPSASPAPRMTGPGPSGTTTGRTDGLPVA